MTGGWAKDGEMLKDAWIYDFTSNRWVKVMHCSKLVLLTASYNDSNSNFAVGPTMANEITPRQAHSAIAINFAPGLIEVTLFVSDVYTKK